MSIWTSKDNGLDLTQTMYKEGLFIRILLVECIYKYNELVSIQTNILTCSDTNL